MRMDIEKLKQEIEKHEGSEQFAYTDSLGYISAGIGRCLDRRKGKGLTREEQLYLLSNDIDSCRAELDPFVWYQQLDDVRKCVMIELCFNMGIRGVLGFRKMIEALKSKNYDTAVIELKDSKWATQIGKDRVNNICYRLKN